AQFRRSAKIAQPLFDNLKHPGEGRTLNTCRSLKILITQTLHTFVSHLHKVHGRLDLCKRSNASVLLEKIAASLMVSAKKGRRCHDFRSTHPALRMILIIQRLQQIIADAVKCRDLDIHSSSPHGFVLTLTSVNITHAGELWNFIQ
ncbi:hypothetical protein, partial [Candidatus Electronema sp. PJ]|uniref:hypothetical protein n=1 Tax=Candidatus Electronema sp. PJ TaxID=3401572 RepID=UPI003AA93EAA